MKKLLIIYLSILLLGAILPINGTNSTLNNNYLLNIRWDYLIHMIIYIPLFPLLKMAQNNQATYNGEKMRNGRNKNITLITISIVIAVSLEALQLIIPWRTFNVNDLMGNVAGVGVGVVLNKMNFIKLKKYVK